MKHFKSFMKLMLMILVFAIPTVITTGCWKPYPVPQMVEVSPEETAFVVPLSGDTGSQVKFDSADKLNQLKVATKRIIIPMEWRKTGRLNIDGEWIPVARVIKVSRSPVTRKWTCDEGISKKAVIQKLSAESKDSVGMSSGFTITAFISEEDTAKFLYRFPATSLADVLDNQIFNDIQSIYSKVTSMYQATELRNRKEEINETVRSILIPKYKDYGITISDTMGLIGGFEYDNPAIQKAIDDVFISQNVEAKRSAEFEAQKKQNELDLAVEKNDAEKRKIKADAEAYEIKAKALAISSSGPTYLEYLRLEIEKSRVVKWSGNYPQVMSGTGAVPIVPIKMD